MVCKIRKDLQLEGNGQLFLRILPFNTEIALNRTVLQWTEKKEWGILP